MGRLFCVLNFTKLMLDPFTDDGSSNVESDPFDTRRFSALPPSRTYLATKSAMQIAEVMRLKLQIKFESFHC